MRGDSVHLFIIYAGCTCCTVRRASMILIAIVLCIILGYQFGIFIGAQPK